MGVKKVWVTGRKLTIVNGEEGRPKPSTGHLGWIKSGSLRGLGDCQGERSGFPVRTFFVKVRLDGFSRTHDAGYSDPVPTGYPSAAQNLFMPLFVCREEFLCSLWLSFENILTTAPFICKERKLVQCNSNQRLDFCFLTVMAQSPSLGLQALGTILLKCFCHDPT